MKTKTQIIAALGISLAVIGVLAVVKYFQISAAIADSAKFAPPPAAVTTVVAKEDTWAETVSAVGTLAPIQGVTISAEEPGKVVQIGFESGQTVAEGALLVALDTTVEEADLAGAVAREERARKNYARMKNLKSSQVVSQDAIDASEAEFEQAGAQARSLQAVIAKKRIVAPFSGTAGIRMVNVGEYVSPGTPLVPLQALEKMYLNFALPQQAIGAISAGTKVAFTVDAFPGEKFEATLNAINPEVSVATRTVEMQATSQNAQGKLRPGMFAHVTVELPKMIKIVPLPSTAINYAPYGDSVYILEPGKDQAGQDIVTVRQQIVQLGEKRGDLVAVLEGVKPGEEVVTSGLFKLRPGAQVVVNNSITPGSNPNPNPADA